MNIVFFHIATIGNYSAMVDDMVAKINEGLISNVDKVYLCYVGSGKVKDYGPKYQRVHMGNTSDYEFPTLEMIRQYCNKHECNILYIHTKGVSTPNNPCINDWRDYMMHFLVANHNECIMSFNNYDSCGVDLRQEPALHYSGNFWWSKSSHIRGLPDFDRMPLILTERHKAEFWICSNGENHRSLWDSGIPVHERHLHRYTEDKYK